MSRTILRISGEALLLALLAPLAMLPLSAFMAHSAACGMYVDTVDNLRADLALAHLPPDHPRWEYGYCTVVKWPAEHVLP